jgi:hypothetical protein
VYDDSVLADASPLHAIPTAGSQITCVWCDCNFTRASVPARPRAHRYYVQRDRPDTRWRPFRHCRRARSELGHRGIR